MDVEIDLNRANFNTIELCASIALLGKRRTGKTTWAKYILQFLNKQIGRFVALCGNKDNTNEWERIIQPLYVMSKNTAYLEKLRSYQDNKVSQYSKNGLPIPKKYRICIILDDCGSDRAFMHSPIIKDILSNGRHYGMTILIICQYLNQMHSENRDQIDYLGMLYTSNQRNIKKVHEEYVNVCDLRTFKYVLNACTVNKGLCWIDNTLTPSKIEDFVFFKKILLPIDFKKVGMKNIRKYGNNHFLNNKQTPTNTRIEYQENRFIADEVETNSDKSDEDYEINLLLNNVPSHILSNKCIFNDKKGTIVIKKETSKEKVE